LAIKVRGVPAEPAQRRTGPYQPDNANGNNRVGLITFFKDQSIMPANQLGSDGTITLYYEMSRHNDVVTTLRYEKPLYLAVNTKTGFGYLGCGELEPVGEEE
jgi:hypothetical protein